MDRDTMTLHYSTLSKRSTTTSNGEDEDTDDEDEDEDDKDETKGGMWSRHDSIFSRFMTRSSNLTKKTVLSS
jgi:hypothetical protein